MYLKYVLKCYELLSNFIMVMYEIFLVIFVVVVSCCVVVCDEIILFFIKVGVKFVRYFFV